MNRTRNSLKSLATMSKRLQVKQAPLKDKLTEVIFLNASLILLPRYVGFPDGAMVKNPPANAGDARDTGLIPESGKSPRIGNSNPLQYSCLGNPMARGAWRATAPGVAKSWI